MLSKSFKCLMQTKSSFVIPKPASFEDLEKQGRRKGIFQKKKSLGIGQSQNVLEILVEFLRKISYFPILFLESIRTMHNFEDVQEFLCILSVVALQYVGKCNSFEATLNVVDRIQCLQRISFEIPFGLRKYSSIQQV